MNTVGEVVSRLRNQIKSVKQDAFVTDRLLYSLAMKHAAWLIRREDNSFKIMRMNGLMQVLKYVELEEVDAVDLECMCIVSGVNIKRSVNELPTIMDGYFGPLIGRITSLDRSTRIHLTDSQTYQVISRQKNYRYNTTLYAWIENKRLYFPNTDWDAVRLECLAAEDVAKWGCDTDSDCISEQERIFPVPDFLFAEIESHVMKDLGLMIQIPSDPMEDNRSITQ